MDLREKIKLFAEERKLEVAFGSSAPFYEYKGSLEKEVPFVSYSLEKRLDPSLSLEGAKTLVALGMSYNRRYERGEGLRARLSEGAVGRDYHLVMEEHLRELCRIIEDNNFKAVGYCDTGPLCDSLVAQRCNLGFLGKNNAVINPKLGSMFFIGYIITTAELKPTEQIESLCNNCGACLRACPTGALTEQGFNWEKCLAWQTQKKGIIEDEYKALMGDCLYGCDICRRICHLNPEAERGQGEGYPLIKNILSLTNKEFKALYGDTAIGWRGRRTIVRNAIIALGNSKNIEALELLTVYLQSEFEDIRDAAQWAYKRLMGENGS